MSLLCIPKSFFIRLQSKFGELLCAHSGRFLKDRMGIVFPLDFVRVIGEGEEEVRPD